MHARGHLPVVLCDGRCGPRRDSCFPHQHGSWAPTPVPKTPSRRRSDAAAAMGRACADCPLAGARQRNVSETSAKCQRALICCAAHPTKSRLPARAVEGELAAMFTFSPPAAGRGPGRGSDERGRGGGAASRLGVGGLCGAAVLTTVVALALPAGALAQASFTARRPATPLSTAPGPPSVVVADVNGDRDHDLAVANRRHRHVTVLLGGARSGSIPLGAPCSRRRRPSSVAVGDFNGESHPDLAVANAAQSVANGGRRYRRCCSATEAGATARRPNYDRRRSSPRLVAVGQFNRDQRRPLTWRSPPSPGRVTWFSVCSSPAIVMGCFGAGRPASRKRRGLMSAS